MPRPPPRGVLAHLVLLALWARGGAGAEATLAGAAADPAPPGPGAPSTDGERAAPGVPPGVAPAASARPSVILVVLDDIGATDLELVHTPTLADLARKGRSFRRGYAMPLCASARRTLMFGDYWESSGPFCTHVPTSDTPDVGWFSLPKVFESDAYDTALFGKWHLGTNDVGQPWQATPELHGFDRTFAVVPANVASPCDGFEGDYYSWLCVQDGLSFVETRYQTLVLRDDFIAWWSSTLGPKFAMVSFQAAHAPFDDPPAELLPHLPPGGPGRTPTRIQFEKLVISLDTALGQMLSFVDLADTYVIVVGDNGTPPNAIGPGQVRDKVKGTPYEGGVRVPFFFVGPGIRPGPSDALVSIVDVLPTLADLFGVARTLPDGRSLVPLLKSPSAAVREHVFVSNEGDRAVIQARYKLIRLDDRERFFDLALDPREESPIPPSLVDAAVVRSLRKAMSAYLRRGL